MTVKGNWTTRITAKSTDRDPRSAHADMDPKTPRNNRKTERWKPTSNSKHRRTTKHEQREIERGNDKERDRGKHRNEFIDSSRQGDGSKKAQQKDTDGQHDNCSTRRNGRKLKSRVQKRKYTSNKRTHRTYTHEPTKTLTQAEPQAKQRHNKKQANPQRPTHKQTINQSENQMNIHLHMHGCPACST